MATPFVLYSTSQKETILQQLEAVIKYWCKSWMGTGNITCKLQEVQDLTSKEIARFKTADSVLNDYQRKKSHSRIWVDEAELQKQICLLLPSAEHILLVTDDLKALLGSCYRELEVALFSSDEEKETNPWVKGTGWFFCHIDIDGFSFHLAIDRSIISQLIDLPIFKTGKKAGLCPLNKAISKGSVELNAVVSSVELTLGEFQQLRVGDLIRLDKNIDGTLPLCNMASQPVCSGYLGKHNDSKAIILAQTKVGIKHV